MTRGGGPVVRRAGGFPRRTVRDVVSWWGGGPPRTVRDVVSWWREGPPRTVGAGPRGGVDGGASTRTLPCQDLVLFPAGSRTATLRVLHDPLRISPRLPCKGSLRRPCGVAGQLTYGPSYGPLWTLPRLPCESPPASYDNYPTDRALPCDPPSVSYGEYPTDGTDLPTDPCGSLHPTDGPLHDLRADLATATGAEMAPANTQQLPYGSLHAHPALRISPCLPYGSHPALRIFP